MKSPITRPPAAASAPSPVRVRGFRTRVLVAMMLVASVVTGLALFLSERNLAANIERELHEDFQSELTALHNAQAVRHAALVERCRALVGKPRIHAALEDNALDLLYPTAEDELRDVMAPGSGEPGGDAHAPTLRARFYRFLDRTGQVITPSTNAPVGGLSPRAESQLALPGLGYDQQVGYVSLDDEPGVLETIATPIISTETGEPIAALVLGFKPLAPVGARPMQSGILVSGRLHLPSADGAMAQRIVATVAPVATGRDEGSLPLEAAGVRYLVFFKRLNPGSHYPPAFEISVYPLDQFAARETRLRVRIVGLGALLIAGAFFASNLFARRLSMPVEKLAVESERSARFSADASHQLKTPVTVLRAGLEELLTKENLTPEECDAIAALIHQTYRLSSLVDDLLLLSRMDSGRLKLALAPVDLAHLIAAALDDLTAMPDEMRLEIETDVPEVLQVSGEQRYTAIILQNLLENARKYNRPNGRIRVAARIAGDDVLLTIANTGRMIAPAAQAHIFERFHRGAMGEDVPGYGLGLNLARELARLHEGDLRLVRSDGEWTEFEARFRLAQPVEAVIA